MGRGCTPLKQRLALSTTRTEAPHLSLPDEMDPTTGRNGPTPTDFSIASQDWGLVSASVSRSSTPLGCASPPAAPLSAGGMLVAVLPVKAASASLVPPPGLGGALKADGGTAPLRRSGSAPAAEGHSTALPEADRAQREFAAESILDLWESRCIQERTARREGRHEMEESHNHHRCGFRNKPHMQGCPASRRKLMPDTSSAELPSLCRERTLDPKF